MKKIKAAGSVIALVLAAVLLTACGKSVLEVTENTGKTVTITAERAARDAEVMFGSLEVEDGEQIHVSSDLSKGSIRVEIIPGAEDQSIDELPEMDGEAIMTGDFVRTDAEMGTVPAGSYLVRATCLERATGTIRIVAEPAGE